MALEVKKDFFIFKPHIVYYTPDGKPFSYGKEEVFPTGKDAETIIHQIDLLLEALDKPVLYIGTRFPKEFHKPLK